MPARGPLRTVRGAVGKLLRRIGAVPSGQGETRGEQVAAFYDRTFNEDSTWKLHYTSSSYYFLWSVIIDRVRRSGVTSVLEVACGTGQLAHALSDAHVIDRYCGFDFSEARVGQARRVCPNLRFEVADAYRTDLFQTVEYTGVIATEFLEHVERDLVVIRSIRPGAHFIGTVPNFPFVSHVRHFRDGDEVAARYASCFRDLTVDAIVANERGKTFFLLEGVRAENP